MNKGERLIRLVKSQTVNMGNYESARVECGFETIVDEKDWKKEIQRLSIQIDNVLEEEFKGLQG